MTAPAAPAKLPPDIQDLLRHEVFYTAQKSIAHLHLLETTGNTFTIGPGTPFETSITLDPASGQVTVEGNLPDSRLHHYPGTRRTTFNRVWNHIQETAQTAVEDAVSAAIGNLPPDTNPGTANNSPWAQTARDVRSTTGCGYLPDPSALGYSQLYSFLGKDLVSKVLATAGPHATMSEIETCRANFPLLEAARAINPNAVTLWFVNNREREHPRHLPQDPASIIDTAKSIFMETCSHWVRPRDQAPQPDLEEIWAAACRLNPRAVARTLKNTADLPSLARIVQTAGATPSFTALITLARIPSYVRSEIDPHILTAFLKESEARTRNRRSQRELAAQFTRTVLETEFTDDRQGENAPDPAPFGTTTRRCPSHPGMTWDQVLEAAAKAAVRHIPSTTRKAGPKTARKTAVRTAPKPPRATREELEHILAHRMPEVVEHANAEALRIDTMPGRRVTMTALGQTFPPLIIEREPSGQIVHRGTYKVHGPLPDPGDPQVDRPNWTTRGLRGTALNQAITGHITRNWERFSPRAGTPKPTANRMALHLHQAELDDGRGRSDADLSEQLRQDVATLLDPRVYDIAAAVCPQPTLEAYNLVAAATDVFEYLLDTNPGTLTWVMSDHSVRQPPRHPSEIIALAKASLAQEGLEPSNWKHTATIPADRMKAVATTCPDGRDPKYFYVEFTCGDDDNRRPKEHTQPVASPRAMVLNAMARTQAAPPPELIRLAVETAADAKRPHRAGPANKAAVTRSVALLLRADPVPADHEVTDVLDYVGYLLDNQIELTSTTWGGLRKASDRWHRDMRETPIRQRWEQMLSQQQGLYRAWDSVLEEHQDSGFTIVPLSSEQDLFLESLHMQHCVISYGTECALYSSRIFSIRQGDRRVATTQLAYRNCTWQHVQTRGKHNHPVGDDVILAAKRLARRYNDAHQLQAEPVPPWWIPAETGAKTPQENPEDTGPEQQAGPEVEDRVLAYA